MTEKRSFKKEQETLVLKDQISLIIWFELDSRFDFQTSYH